MPLGSTEMHLMINSVLISGVTCECIKVRCEYYHFIFIIVVKRMYYISHTSLYHVHSFTHLGK